MKQILADFLNKLIEIRCDGTTIVRGTLLDIMDEVAKLEDEDKVTIFVAIAKINVFWEVKEKEKPVGFISKAKAKD